jgi:hypothetical protein
MLFHYFIVIIWRLYYILIKTIMNLIDNILFNAQCSINSEYLLILYHILLEVVVIFFSSFKSFETSIIFRICYKILYIM